MRVLFASFLLLFCTFLKAQNTTIVEHQHLTFCGISLNNTATAFADSLMAKGFKTETAPPQLPINKTNTILSGRFESIPCIVEIGKNTNEQVDTVRIFFTNVNNPLRSYRILTNIYRTRYGNPIFENYYETRCATATGSRPFCNNILCQWWHSSIFVAIQFSSIRIHLHPTAYQH